MPESSNRSFPFKVPKQIVTEFRIAPMRATWSTHLVIFEFIILIKFGLQIVKIDVKNFFSIIIIIMPYFEN